jgi:hypothetical protein
MGHFVAWGQVPPFFVLFIQISTKFSLYVCGHLCLRSDWMWVSFGARYCQFGPLVAGGHFLCFVSMKLHDIYPQHVHTC